MIRSPTDETTTELLVNFNETLIDNLEPENDANITANETDHTIDIIEEQEPIIDDQDELDPVKLYIDSDGTKTNETLDESEPILESTTDATTDDITEDKSDSDTEEIRNTPVIPKAEPMLKQDQNPRRKRHRTPPRVEIHNIRSALPEPEIEVLYTVYKGKQTHLLLETMDKYSILIFQTMNLFLPNWQLKSLNKLRMRQLRKCLGFP